MRLPLLRFRNAPPLLLRRLGSHQSTPVFCSSIIANNFIVGGPPRLSPIFRTFRHAAVRLEDATINPNDNSLPEASVPTIPLRLLPRSCPGCGAITQWIDKDEPGFYDLNRKSVRTYVAALRNQDAARHVEEKNTDAQDTPVLEAQLDPGLDSGQSALEDRPTNNEAPKNSSKISILKDTPVCDRCHNLIHHHKGVSIYHPSMDSIEDTIDESPYKYNHIYHVLDAADFPLSLIPNLQNRLYLSPQRSKNRRSKAYRYYHGSRADLSFIITRSDLLAPTKEQVDRLMPYLTQVLRDALGRSGQDIRLGNVHCVSAKRGWWTRDLKEKIYKRGGAGWMVGKVNVGKSNLFESVFPKGRNQDMNVARLRDSETANITTIRDPSQIPSTEAGTIINSDNARDNDFSDENSLLPPAQPETAYPVMPVISSLPGTTASPIRLPFGNGKGELIDLPGLARGDLEKYVLEDHKLDLVMDQRIKPVQQVIKPGQSLLLGGGLIRITPRNAIDIVLAYPFTTLPAHLTSTEKAIAIQSEQREAGITSIMRPGTGEIIASAGTYVLRWDVTKARSGPVTNPVAIGIDTDRLPYQVLATDILIEGCGWVELASQIRKRELEKRSMEFDDGDENSYLPAVEIFTPHGKYVGARRPMNAWLLCNKKPGVGKMKGRPRRAMKGVKKMQKMETRKQAAVI
ncbi:MAG: hypothetical protein M1834_002981 [Cirrosporium novae-zelandiae]|nr:MAG: hypothetical protein M1834_002981 [Cirrosporium novae-zelandiae]